MAIPRVLIVDDDPSVLNFLSTNIESVGYDVTAVDNAKKALVSMSMIRPDVIVTDLHMEGMDGFALLNVIYEMNPLLPVIVLTGYGSIPKAVDAIKQGVFSFLTKPFDYKELLEQINKALALSGRRIQEHQDGTNSNASWRSAIITRSPVMEDILSQAKLIAQSDVSVLINGPSGSGKELFAKAIHNASPRRNKSFVAINCSAIPEALLESELFGHRKGSFTGATKDHQGLLLSATGGTLFLDEIGDMPIMLQAKLLRVLQESMVRPVGSTVSKAIDVRIISATHKNLEQAMADCTFREDLYYRLNVVSVDIPPLNKRREDIPLLIQHFLHDVCKRNNKKITSFSTEAMELLVKASWPGNVRQLLNVVEQVVTLSTTPVVSASLVSKALKNPTSKIPTYNEAKSQFERNYLCHLLQITSGKVSQAAELANRNRTQFYRLLNRHNIDPTLFKKTT